MKEFPASSRSLIPLYPIYLDFTFSALILLNFCLVKFPTKEPKEYPKNIKHKAPYDKIGKVFAYIV